MFVFRSTYQFFPGKRPNHRKTKFKIFKSKRKSCTKTKKTKCKMQPQNQTKCFTSVNSVITSVIHQSPWKHKNTNHPDKVSRELTRDVDVIKERDKFHCDECNYSSKAKNSLKKHQEKNHYVNKYKECDICGDKFSNQVNLNEHIKDSHLNNSKHSSNDCEECTADEVCEGCLDWWIAKGNANQKDTFEIVTGVCQGRLYRTLIECLVN